jgi:hypothetical protein
VEPQNHTDYSPAPVPKRKAGQESEPTARCQCCHLQACAVYPSPCAEGFPSGGVRERIRLSLPMRVRVSDPTFLQDLCDFLSRQGCVAVEVSEDEAEVLVPGAGSGFEAATMVMSEVGIWRVKRAGVRVAVEPER